jgi:hypothetical protein
LFDEFRPEDRIPKDQLRRRIIVFVTPVLGEWRQLLASPAPIASGFRLRMIFSEGPLHTFSRIMP